MSRNGSGTYTLPAGNPVVTHTFITSAWANTTMPDIGAALTQSISKDGQTTPTQNLPMGTFAHTNVAKAVASTMYARGDQVQSGELTHLTAVSMPTANNYAANLIFGLTTQALGQLITGIFGTTNTSLATLNINGAGSHPIRRPDGSNLQPGDLTTGQPVIMLWTGVYWSLLGVGGSTGGGGTAGVTSWNGRTGAVNMTKLDVENALTYVPMDPAGATMAGALILNTSSPTTPLQAASKGYVDGKIGAGGTVTGITTGTPTMMTINNVNPAIPQLNVVSNTANGVLQLDSNGQIPPGFLANTSLTFLGVFSALAGTLPPTPSVATGNAYYLINEAGTLTLFVKSGAAYVQQAQLCSINDEIIYMAVAQSGRPIGWYYSSHVTSSTAAATTMTPTPTYPSATNVQAWANLVDPAINTKFPYSGGTLTGNLTLFGAPSTDLMAANKKYVDDLVSAGTAGVVTWQGRSGVVTMLSSDINTVLGYVPVSPGGVTFTGPVYLPNTTPTLDTQATTKAYVDSKAAAGGISSIVSADTETLTASTVVSTTTLTPITNVPNGLAKLDGEGLIPQNLLPTGGLSFAGEWDASGGTLPPTAGLDNGTFYVIAVSGTLLLLRDSGSNVYVPTPTLCNVGDDIILRVGSTDPNAPDGWYYIPRNTNVTASTVTMVATPSFPGLTNVQSWMDAADPAITGKLNLSGGTMTGPMTLQGNAAAALQPTTLQQLQSAIAAVNIGVSTYNGRTGVVLPISDDVTTALGYTPLSTGGGTLTGPLVGTTVTATQLVAKRLSLTVDSNAPPGGVVDFTNAQTRFITLTGPFTITTISGIDAGNIGRILFRDVSAINTVTWPASVKWPAPTFAPPAFDAGPEKRVIVVLEYGGATNYYANASVY